MNKKNDNHEDESAILLNERSFIDEMSQPLTENLGIEKQLVNDNNKDLDELVHPLTHSIDVKKHPDMIAIPVCYKFSRNLYKKLKEITD